MLIRSSICRKDVYEPPYATTIACDDFQDPHTDIVKEESLPTKEYCNNEDDGRSLKAKTENNPRFGIIDRVELLLDFLKLKRLEAFPVPEEKRLDKFLFHKSSSMSQGFYENRIKRDQ